MPSPFKPNPARDALWAELKAKVLGCFGHTTAHGCGRIAAAAGHESRARRWFWFIICCAAYAAFSIQLFLVAKQFVSKPLATRISIGHETELAFPQITICNLNIMRRSKVPRVILTEFPEILGGVPPKQKNTSASKKNRRESSNNAVPNLGDLPDKQKFILSVLHKFSEIPEESLVSYGHQLEDLIISCNYNHMECLDDDRRKSWTRFWHRNYGNCFSFNKGTDENGLNTEVMTISNAGIGLTLEINIEQEEYISTLSQEAGVRVFIGGQHEMPFPFEQGLSVPPGFSSAIQLRKVVIGRLDPFKNKSCEARTGRLHDSMFARYNVTYTTQACKMSCLAAMMNNSCGCVWFTLKYSDVFPVCDSEDKSVVSCANNIFVEFDHGACEKECKQKCREDTFKTSVSLAKWPSRKYKESLLAEIEQTGRGNHSESLSDNFLKLMIYYGELNYEVIEEEEAYTPSSFWSDVGGLMGMWIGISVLTLVELLELMVTLLFTLYTTLTKKESRVVDVKPSTDDSEHAF